MARKKKEYLYLLMTGEYTYIGGSSVVYVSADKDDILNAVEDNLDEESIANGDFHILKVENLPVQVDAYTSVEIQNIKYK